MATVGIDIVLGILTKRAAGKIKGAGNLDEADNVNTSRADDVDNTLSTNSKKPTTEEPASTSSRVGDETTANSRSRRMNTGAKVGVAPSDYSIKVGTVRMKEHPNYQNLIDEVESKGYKIVEDSEARISYVEVINKKKEVIAIEKELHVLPDMRYIDLEHEVGHIKQLERFDGELYTDRYIQRPDGSRKLYDNDLPHVLSQWQDTVTEYHNRLDEFLRLYERNASPELLLEHQSEANQGVDFWRELYRKAIGTKGKTKPQWVKEHFPDLKELEANYNKVINELQQTYPSIFDSYRMY